MGALGVDSCGSRGRSVADYCEHGNELSGSTEDEEFLDQLSNYYLLKNIPYNMELVI
jgi:hypothetical protein